MDKKQFRDLVIPLNEKELAYRQDPSLSEEFYRQADIKYCEQDGVYEFRFLDFSKAESTHGQILPMQSRRSPYRNIVFNKQTRFSRVPPHRHTWLELFYIYSGHCGAVINGKRVALAAGDVCIMDTGVVHRIEPVGEEDLVLNCLFRREYFNAQFIGRLASSGTVAQFLAGALSGGAVHDRYLLFHTAGAPLVRELIEDAFCEYLDPGVCTQDTLDSYMTLLFIQLARCYQESKEQEYRADSRSYPTEVLHYIEENYTDCTLAGTAARFGFNPDYLSRMLKKATGFSFKDLVDQNRLQQAAFLLRNADLPIAEIAAQCGWNNLNQFYKKFGENYGESPRQYRSGSA